MRNRRRPLLSAKTDATATRFVYLPDPHGTFIDWQAAECALAFTRAHKPHIVVVGGDVVDFYQLSRFDKNPTRALGLQDDIDAGKRFLAGVRKHAKHARILYLEGNHENRLTRWLWGPGAAVVKLQGMSVPSLLRVAEHGIRYVESGVWQHKTLCFKHGHYVRSRAGYTATAELQREGMSGCSGHTHRIGEVSLTNRGGTYKWVEAGCLCQLTPEYMVGQTPDWQQGLAYGTFMAGGRFALHTAHILSGKTLYGDKVVAAQ